MGRLRSFFVAGSALAIEIDWDDFADRRVKILDGHMADKAPRPGKP